MIFTNKNLTTSKLPEKEIPGGMKRVPYDKGFVFKMGGITGTFTKSL